MASPIIYDAAEPKKLQWTFALRVFLGFLLVILVIGITELVSQSLFISQKIIGRAQREVGQSIKVAWNVYQSELDQLKTIAFFVAQLHGRDEQPPRQRLVQLKNAYGLDYLVFEPAGQAAVPRERLMAATRVLAPERLGALDPALPARAFIPEAPAPLTKPGRTGDVTRGLVMEASAAVYDAEDRWQGVVRAGKLLNRNFALVDKIRSIIVEDRSIEGKPMGNVTIFLEDQRVATNVLTDSGERAIGTRVSATVYDKVLGEGRSWLDRAFVVNDWYLTAYEPIRDYDRKVIGILYVGLLEKPFLLLKRQQFLSLSLILLGAVLLCLLLSFELSLATTRPLKALMSAAQALEKGDQDARMVARTSIVELNVLARTFNSMAQTLAEEKSQLLVANQKLDAASKNYLNMIGFVSHELKGVLGSIMMNVYSLRDGYLGSLNAPQQKAVDASARSLDHFEMMVKNYLDLSRIEKGELKVNKMPLDLLEDAVRPSLATFEKQLAEKRMAVRLEVPAGLRLTADRHLLQIVFNNLIPNALKYGRPGGSILIACREDGRLLRCDVYNGGQPIASDQVDLLFKRFSRLPEAGGVKGTGLGLFITREIIEKHGGKIWVEPRETGNTFCFTLNRGEEHGA